MAYLRWGAQLPSGKQSEYYVYKTSSGLERERLSKENLVISHKDLTLLLLSASDEITKKELRTRLELEGEELDVVCERLFRERKTSGKIMISCFAKVMRFYQTQVA